MSKIRVVYLKVSIPITATLSLAMLTNMQCWGQNFHLYHGKQITEKKLVAVMLLREADGFFHSGENDEFIAAATQALKIAPELAKVQASFGTAMTIAEKEVSLKALTLHEIGHSLGILGHGSSPNDVMYFSVTGSQTEKKSQVAMRAPSFVFTPND